MHKTYFRIVYKVRLGAFTRDHGRLSIVNSFYALSATAEFLLKKYYREIIAAYVGAGSITLIFEEETDPGLFTTLISKKYATAANNPNLTAIYGGHNGQFFELEQSTIIPRLTKDPNTYCYIVVGRAETIHEKILSDMVNGGLHRSNIDRIKYIFERHSNADELISLIPPHVAAGVCILPSKSVLRELLKT